MTSRVLRVDICLPVHNEEKNIGRLLANLNSQPLPPDFELEQLVVVTSCTDKTEKIAREFSRHDNRIKVIREKERRGKSAAINTMLSVAKGDIVLISSGDVIPEKGSIYKLLGPFKDPSVGYTGGRPVPLDGRDTFWGYAGHVIWDLQSYFASQEGGKLGGEMNAFRTGLVKYIPADIINDDLYLQLSIEKQGYRAVYVPDAVIFSRTPRSIKDYIRQRRRVRVGHMQIKKKIGVSATTADPIAAMRVVLRQIVWLFMILAIEGSSYLLALIDYYRNKLPTKGWPVARTTKEIDEESILQAEGDYSGSAKDREKE